MTGNKYYAHTKTNTDGTVAPEKEWQPLKDHLQNVADLARRFAEEAKPGDTDFAAAAEAAGLLHDLGKYQQEFQDYLHGKRTASCPHSPIGAVKGLEYGIFHAFSPAGHHSGLPAKENLKIISSKWKDVVGNLWNTACKDLPLLLNLQTSKLEIHEEFAKNSLTGDVLIRMLFSCLVDADWCDTNAWDKGEYPYKYVPLPLNAVDRLKQVCKYISAKPHEGAINAIRKEVLNSCLKSAELSPGFFSLTVPTGGGKTLSSLSFAVKHCKQHGHRRIIYVIPYLNILEQTAKVFYDALGVAQNSGVIFEHHSLAYAGRFEKGGSNDTEESQTAWARRMEENWEAPVILTTSVQFFESLFSNRPAAARKLHNIARSVVIFDECQSFPSGLYSPTLSVLRELVRAYGVSFVFCTATQPAVKQSGNFLQGIPQKELREIIPNPPKIFNRMHQRPDTVPRISVLWPSQSAAPLTWEQLAEQMRQAGSALAIVNLKSHAKKLFKVLNEKNEGECHPDIFHLSAIMCPRHRLDILEKIREKLAKKQNCLVAATQLVEAGMDLDFPAVFRAMGPLDSMAQAAGRCNREGRLKGIDGKDKAGNVSVFIPELSDNESETPPGEYRIGAAVAKEFLEGSRMSGQNGPDILNPRIFEKYFATLTGRLDLDSKAIQGDPANSPRDRLNFPEVSRRYRLIDSLIFQVIVPYSPDGNYENSPAQKTLKMIHNTKHVWTSQARKIQPYLVNLYESDFNKARSMMLLSQMAEGWWEWIGDYDLNLGILFQPRKIPVI